MYIYILNNLYAAVVLPKDFIGNINIHGSLFVRLHHAAGSRPPIDIQPQQLPLKTPVDRLSNGEGGSAARMALMTK